MKQLLQDIRAKCENATNYELHSYHKTDDGHTIGGTLHGSGNIKDILLILDAMDKMRVALEFYANDLCWHQQKTVYEDFVVAVDGIDQVEIKKGFSTGGKRARQTLRRVFGDE